LVGGNQLTVRSVPDAVSIRFWGLSGTPEDVGKIIKIFREVVHANSSSEIRETGLTETTGLAHHCQVDYHS